MSRETEDWSDLQAVWRDHPEPDDASVETLRAQVQRERGRMRRDAAAEAVVALFCAGVFLWWGLGAEGGSRMIFAALALVSVASLVVTIGMRRHVWRAHGGTVSAYRAMLRRQARLGLLFARLGYVGAPLGVGVGLLIGGVVDTASTAAAPGVSTAVGVVAVAALAAGWLWSLREARRHRATLAALADAEG